jgi:spermidine/putrescine transport system substrate-binding protein
MINILHVYGLMIFIVRLKIKIYKTINTIFKKGNKMKKILLLLLAISLICGCKKQETLYIYNWSDYIDPEFIVKFENENNCKVVIDTFDSNETMYAKLKAGASGYDICFPTEYFIPILKNENIIEKIDITKLPNVEKNIDKRFCKNNRLEYYIPYAFSCTGILYRKDKFSNINIKNWNDMFAMKSIARICMFNDIREIIGIALKSNGFSVNSTNQNELLIALKTAHKWKTSVIKMDNEGYKNGVANGEIDFAMGYNSDAIQLMLEMENDIEFIVPAEAYSAYASHEYWKVFMGGEEITFDEYITDKLNNIYYNSQGKILYFNVDSPRVVVVYDTMGRIIMKEVVDATTQQLFLDLNRGIYVINITTTNQSTVQNKIIVK